MDIAELSRKRRTWFTALAVVFALIFGVVLFGWLGLVFGWFQGGVDQIHRIHSIGGTGVGTGVLIATPLLILAWRRDDVALLQTVAMLGIAYAIASGLATDWVTLALVPILAVPVVALLWVGDGRSRFVAAGEGFAVRIFVITLVGAAFWIAYAVTMAANQRNGSPSDPHVQMHHWTEMSGMALGIVLLGLLASLRTKGWRIVAWLAGLGAFVYGLASIVFAKFPGTDVPYPGGEGVGWGLLAVAWGVAFISVAELERRRSALA